MTDKDTERRLDDRLEWLVTDQQAGRYVAAFDLETLCVSVADTVSDNGLFIPLSDLPRLIALLSAYDLTAAILGLV